MRQNDFRASETGETSDNGWGGRRNSRTSRALDIHGSPESRAWHKTRSGCWTSKPLASGIRCGSLEQRHRRNIDDDELAAAFACHLAVIRMLQKS